MPDEPNLEGLLQAIQGQAGQSPMQQFSPLGQFGAGLAGLGAGMQGQVNPVLDQARLRHDASMRQQVEMIRLQQSVQRQRQDKLKLNLEMNREMMDAAKDPSTRKILAKQRAELFDQSGFTTPPGMIQSWASKQYTSEQEKQFVTAFFGKEQDPNAVPEIAQRFGLTPDQATYYQHAASNERQIKAMGLPTRTSMQKEVDEAQKIKADSWLATHQQFKDSGTLHGVAGHAEEFVQKMYKKSLFDLTQQNPDDAKMLTAAATYAQTRARTAFLGEKQAESDIVKQREIDVATAKGKLKSLEPKPLSQRERALVLKPFDTADTALSEIGTMMGAVGRLNAQGYLATDTTWLSQNYAQFQRWWEKSGDPDVLLIKQFTAPVTIGLIDRGLNDEKGTRAMQMFHAQIEIVTKFPTMEGYQKLFGFYQYLFGRLASKQLRRVESQIGKLPDDVVEEAQRMYLEMFPKGLPVDPTLPPGMKRGQ